MGRVKIKKVASAGSLHYKSSCRSKSKCSSMFAPCCTSSANDPNTADLLPCADFEGWSDRWFLAQFLLSCGFGFILILATVTLAGSKKLKLCTLDSGGLHPIKFCPDNNDHWLSEEHPDHLPGHDDWRRLPVQHPQLHRTQHQCVWQSCLHKRYSQRNL